MPDCPYCNQSLADDFNFCPACCHQVKCLNVNCGRPLVHNAPICVSCGTTAKPASPIGAAQNRFVRSVKQSRTTYEENTEIVATDAALGMWAPFVVGQVGGARQQPPFHRNGPTAAKAVEQGRLALDVGDAPAEPTVDAEERNTTAIPSEVDWSQVFERSSSGELNLIQPDMKGKSRKEQQDRFSLLFIGAHEDLCEGPPAKDALFSAAKRARVYDSKNFATYAGKLTQWVIYADGTLKLNPHGRARVREIIKEMSDCELTGTAYWNGSIKSSRSVSRVSKEDLGMVDEWVQVDVEVGAIDVRVLGGTQQAMVSLWLLTNQLKVADAVKPVIAYTYLTKRFTTIDGTQKAFTDAFSRRENEKRFGRTNDGKYFLRPEGIAEVEALRDGRTLTNNERGNKR